MERLAAVQAEAVEAGKLAATLAAGSIVKSDGVRLPIFTVERRIQQSCHTDPLLCREMETSLWIWLRFVAVVC